jgi:hypothetical protein
MRCCNRAITLALTGLISLLLFIETGCIKRPEVTSKPIVGPPLTDEECNRFALDLKEVLNSGNATAAYKMVDWESILEASMEGVNASESSRKGFIEAFKSTKGRPYGIMDKLVESMKSEISYDFLRIQSKDQEKHVIFRLITPTGGVNYHDWVLARRPNGSVQAVDLYIFASGERTTENARRFFLSNTVPESEGSSKSKDGEPEFVRNFPKIKQITELAKNKKYHESLAVYHQLPASLKTDKNILLIRIAIAQNVGGSEYYSAIEDLLKNYPDDPSADLLGIDLYIAKENHSKALECINRLDGSVGGDPYLKVLRSGIYLKSGNLNEARLASQKAIEEEPTLKGAYWSLVNVSLQEKKFDETVDLLNLFAEKFKVEIGDLTKEPDYAEFVRSPQYQKWMKSREKK